MKPWHLLSFIVGGILFIGAASTSFQQIPAVFLWIIVATCFVVWVELTK